MEASSSPLDECGQATFRVNFKFEVDREIIFQDQNYVVEVVAARAALHMARKAGLGWREFALYLGNEMATELRPFRWESNVYAVETMHVEGMPAHFFGKIDHVFHIETETKIYKAKYEMRLEFHNRRKLQPTEAMKPFTERYSRLFGYDAKNPKCQRFARVFENVRDELKRRKYKLQPRRNKKEKIVGPYGPRKGERRRIKNWEPKDINARAKFIWHVRRAAERNGDYGPVNLGKLNEKYRVYGALNDLLERLNVRSTGDDTERPEQPAQQSQQQQPMEL